MRFPIAVVLALMAVACASPPDAYAVKGHCVDGAADGPYELVLPSGRTQVSGSFARGVKEGAFVIYSSWGPKVAQVPYHDDLLQGTVKLWYMPESQSDTSVRRKLESSYVSGRREGPTSSWYPDGTQRSKTIYAEGALVRAEAWEPSGAALGAEDAQRMAAYDVDADRVLYAAYEEAFQENPIRCKQP